MKKLVFYTSLIPAISVFNGNEDNLLPNFIGILWITGLYLFYTQTKKGKQIIKVIK